MTPTAQVAGPDAATARAARTDGVRLQILADCRRGLETLAAHKLRSLLTMLGMIFGVAAVVSMMSIGAGAQQQVLAFIEQLGVRNLIVEAREAPSWQEMQKTRKTSPGLTESDLRIIRANVGRITASTARKRYTPQKLMPKSVREMPQVFGVEPIYQQIAGLAVVNGRFFDARDQAAAAPVAVLGEGARTNMFGPRDPVGAYIKVNEQWFRVIGVVGPQASAETDVAGIPAQDRNNLIYVPVSAAILRMEDSYSRIKDEIDGIYLQMATADDTVLTSDIVRGLLNASHHDTDDFNLVVPSALLAQQRRTQRIFGFVMVALASISLLVGGIGIMNIMLASVLERTREIGVRRAVGARQTDIVRQFLIETVMIAFVGGAIGLLVGVGLSRLIAILAGWSTIVTPASILISFLVSVTVGLVFGVYPAVRASKLDPVAALHYE